MSRSTARVLLGAAIGLWIAGAALPAAGAVVFRASEPVRPGDVVLLYGGGLADIQRVSVTRLPDGDPGTPPGRPANIHEARVVEQPALQPSDASLKFVIPASMQTGVFAVAFGGEPMVLDAPKVEWSQPTELQPGLNENEAPTGSTIQICGRNFTLAGGSPEPAKVTLRGADGSLFSLPIQSRDKYTIVAVVPQSVRPGEYQLWVHNGYGGAAGWGSPGRIRIKPAAAWPATIFNVADFGGQGDNLFDNSEAFRRALDAAENNGGGIVQFPAGSFQLKGWFRIPQRVVVRGASMDRSWLKWPQTSPASEADLLPATLFTSGEFGIENISIQVRNAQVVLRDLSSDALVGGNPPFPQLAGHILPLGKERDIFLRNVRFDYRYYQYRPTTEPAADPRWIHNRFGWGSFGWHGKWLMLLGWVGVRNVEVSHCVFIGGTQRFLDCRNGRFVGNAFDNQLATLSFTDVGGEYVVFEHNEINGASSWRPNLLPLRYLYCADNHSSNIVPGEREALTFDINWIEDGVLGRPRSLAWDFAPLPPVRAWEGRVAGATGTTLQLSGARFQPRSYVGLEVQVMSGKGAGQFREVEANLQNQVEVERPWDVTPDQSSVVLIHQMLRNIILFRNRAEDTSVLFQIWGQLYDCVMDSNQVARSSGMWGTGGWFVQWLDNRIDTYLEIMGPFGGAAEHGPEYGVLGFVISGKLLQLPIPIQYVRGCIIRRNHLTYHERILVMLGYGGPRRKAPIPIITAQDIVIDHNRIEDSPVGIELDANVGGAVIAGNVFSGVEEPLRLAAPENVLVIQ